MNLTDTDKKLVAEMQRGLPVCARPFEELGRRVGMTEAEVVGRVREWRDAGIVRRLGAFIVHGRAGFRANGMVVWDVAEERLAEVGRRVAARESVSHCYARPRSERWPFRLYTMIHGHTREEVEAEARAIAESEHIESYRILFSTRELKKTETKLFTEEDE